MEQDQFLNTKQCQWNVSLMSKENKCIEGGPLTLCSCHGNQRECSEGRYYGNDSLLPCKFYRNMAGLVEWCNSDEAKRKAREKKLDKEEEE